MTANERHIRRSHTYKFFSSDQAVAAAETIVIQTAVETANMSFPFVHLPG